MKKILFYSLAISMSITASAQSLIKEMDNADTRFIPGVYMKSGEAAIYFSSDEYGYEDGGQSNYEAEIFDFELRPLKSFNFQILHPYTVTEQRASVVSKELTKVIRENRLLVLGLPSVSDMDTRKNAFISWYYDKNKYYDSSLTIESLTSSCRVQGTTIYLSLPKNEYVQYADYRKSIEVYLDDSDEYGFIYTYATMVPVCNGEWVKTTWYDVPVSNFCTPRCTDVAGLNHWNGGVFLPFSQTFFNDDEKFEYVRFKAEIAEDSGLMNGVTSEDSNVLKVLFGITETDRDGDGVEDYRSTHFGIKRTGLEIVSEDGKAIYSFPLPENCVGNPTIHFFKSDNHILAQIDFDRIDEQNHYINSVRFYRIDKASGVAKVVREENHLSVSPNPVYSGTPVRVKLPEGNRRNQTVSVTTLSGTQVFSMPVEADETEVSIPTRSLSVGIYLLSLIEGDRLIGNHKIVVR